ncbi:MAG: hypothetical protein AAF555_06990 [Verrucomicrobiota bacterium]
MKNILVILLLGALGYFGYQFYQSYQFSGTIKAQAAERLRPAFVLDEDYAQSLLDQHHRKAFLEVRGNPLLPAPEEFDMGDYYKALLPEMRRQAEQDDRDAIAATLRFGQLLSVFE